MGVNVPTQPTVPKCAAWEYVGKARTAETAKREEEVMHPTNCKNCGAVLKSATCEYCGTTYETRPRYDGNNSNKEYKSEAKGYALPS